MTVEGNTLSTCLNPGPDGWPIMVPSNADTMRLPHGST